MPKKAKPKQGRVIPSNKLFYGDNIEVLRKYIRDETVDLCYIDPPFNSARTYNQIYNRIGKEDKAQAQAFIDTWTWDETAESGYSEIIANEKNLFTKECVLLLVGLEKVLRKDSLLSYLVHMTLRVAEIHRTLKPKGSLYLHCDPTASHYLKLILDSVFIPKGGDIRNEIIWCYTGPGSPGMRQFMRKHDVVFWYNKSNEWIFNRDKVRVEHSKKTKDNYKKGLVGSGFAEAEHKIHEKGKVPEDWWQIAIAARGKEYLGYPTQKPEALLERIIEASSNEGETILDAYCGCGTSVAVAERLNRKWIGIDITYQSISLVLNRLEEQAGKKILNTISISGVPEDFDSAVALANKKDDRTRKEFEKWAVLTFSENRAIINEKKGGDKGIDGIAFVYDLDDNKKEILKSIIFSVKSDKVLAPKVIRELNGTIEREKAGMGILITLYPMKNLVREGKTYGLYKNNKFQHSYSKIRVVSVEEILAGARMDIPIVLNPLRETEQKGKNVQQNLGFE